MRGEQHLGGGRLERDAALEADDGVAEVDAAADAECRADRLDLLDQADRIGPLAVERAGHAGLEADRVARGRARIREGVLRQHPGAVGNAAVRGERFLAADGHAPQAAIDGIRGAERRHRKLAGFEVLQLFRAA